MKGLRKGPKERKRFCFCIENPVLCAKFGVKSRCRKPHDQGSLYLGMHPISLPLLILEQTEHANSCPFARRQRAAVSACISTTLDDMTRD
jgi:hypothetical protein